MSHNFHCLEACSRNLCWRVFVCLSTSMCRHQCIYVCGCMHLSIHVHVYMCMSWAAANGGVTNGGLRGVWPPFLEIGRNRPFSPFFCLFRTFLEGAKSTWEIRISEEKGLFPQISSDLLRPPSLKPPFVARQMSVCVRICEYKNVCICVSYMHAMSQS